MPRIRQRVRPDRYKNRHQAAGLQDAVILGHLNEPAAPIALSTPMLHAVVGADLVEGVVVERQANRRTAVIRMLRQRNAVHVENQIGTAIRVHVDRGQIPGPFGNSGVLHLLGVVVATPDQKTTLHDFPFQWE